MGWWFASPFPDCSVCKRVADDGGWLDKDYRFWVCIECDDWLDEIVRHNKEQDKGIK